MLVLVITTPGVLPASGGFEVMWSATIGMVLMVMGFVVVLGPILYAVHLSLVDGREHGRTQIALRAEEITKFCPYCDEALRERDLVTAS